MAGPGVQSASLPLRDGSLRARERRGRQSQEVERDGRSARGSPVRGADYEPSGTL